ncbi:MAG: CinA family protein [Oscillospiraceae bacterium]|jgi:PncC family amidohydrolase|nr:CinA family protein [Oscillospiraceae bacterium]
MIDIDKTARDVVRLLRERGLRVAFAESCTGGMISAAITSVPGSSAVLEACVVTYANWAKEKYAGVTNETLAAHGAVSAETALAMANGIRLETGSDIGGGVTGIAGPDGGSDEKPVGTVYIAVSLEGESQVLRLVMNRGDRQSLRAETTRQTLVLLRDFLRRN